MDAEVFTASFVFDKSPSSDERYYIGLAEQQLGKKGLHINEEEFPILSSLPESLHPDVPSKGLLFQHRYDHLAGEMHKHGSRVVLTWNRRGSALLERASGNITARGPVKAKQVWAVPAKLAPTFTPDGLAVRHDLMAGGLASIPATSWNLG